MNYEQLKAKFSKARDPSKGAVLANNTRVVKDGIDYAVRYHDTNVVTVKPLGDNVLNSGGWMSKTTKERFNEYADNIKYVSQSKGQWTVHTCTGSYPYKDGMTISPSGVVTGQGEDHAADEKLRKSIVTYAKKFAAALYAGKIDKPSHGDCWACCMDKAIAPAHIIEHVNENYFVPSLLFNALNAMGASRAELHDASYYSHCDGWENNKPFLGVDNGSANFIRSGIEKCIKRYCLQQCGLPY